MAPWNGQRRAGFTAEQIAWHVFSVSIIGLMLIVLLVSVQSLGEPNPSVEALPIERATAPKRDPHDESGREHWAVGRGPAPIDRLLATG